MSGGGDSAGIGASCAAVSSMRPKDGALVADTSAMGIGAGMLVVAGVGAQVEQQIEPCEQSPGDPRSQP